MRKEIIELPCCIGDTVYVVCYEEGKPWEIDEYIVLGGNHKYFFVNDLCAEEIVTLRIADIGKFIFFSKAEATFICNKYNKNGAN